MRIFFKIFLIILLVGALSFLGAYEAARTSSAALTSERINLNAQRGQALLRQLALSIQNHIVQWEAFSHSQELLEVLEESNKHYKSISDVKAYIDQIDANWSANGPDSQEIVDRLQTNSLADVLKLQQHEFEEAKGYPLFPEIFVTNSFGANVSMTNPTSDFRQNDEEWWEEAMKGGVFLGDVGYDESAQVYSVDLGLRIGESERAALGIMKVIINLRQIIEIVEKSRGENEILILLDSENRVIHASGIKIDPLSSYKQTFSSSLPGRDVLRNSESFIRKDGESHREFLSVLVSIDDEEYFDSLNWKLLLEYPLDILNQPSRALASKIIWGSLPFLLVLVLLGGLLALSIANRISRLRNAAAEVTSGNYEAQVPVSGKDELAELGRAFNLMTSKLGQSTRELERSNKELDDFAYVASHDLRAPLRAIQNLAKWIEEDAGQELSDEASGDLSLLQERATRMERLLLDLLDYSRAGRITEKIENIDTDILVSDIVSFLSLPDGFDVSVEKNMPFIRTVRAPLEKVFRNLISNAVKHHDRDSGQIVVSPGKHTDDYFEFFVADDGPGIPEELHEQAFQMFTTLKPRDEVEGSGMGLAMVKKTLDSIGGSIVIDNKQGRGTIFQIRIPRLLEDDNESGLSSYSIGG